MSEPRITFGMIVFNGEPFVRYNLRSVYPFAYQIIVVEGACFPARSIATKDGHSTDLTLDTLKRFKKEEDPDNKVIIVTAEDENHENGFWSEKDEMSQAYARRAKGDYIWQIDSDEFYHPDDMGSIVGILRKKPEIAAISFLLRTFWGGIDYITDGSFLHYFVAHRIFAWGPGYRYVGHRPPTVVDSQDRDLRTKKTLGARELARKGIFLYHYELLFPKQVRDKCVYYANAEWASNYFQELEKWIENSYFNLNNPYHVHMVYQYKSWLERFYGKHPPLVTAMVEDVRKGMWKDIELRRTDDIERLLSNYSYRFPRTIMKIISFFNIVPMSKNMFIMLKRSRGYSKVKYFCKSLMKKGSIPLFKINIDRKLTEGWKSSAIPHAQRKIVEKELQNMYRGEVVAPYKALAEAITATDCGKGNILEVGCATCYYSEVLTHLLGYRINYRGIDYSEAMIREARRIYPDINCDLGDATALPYADNSYDILISGCVILHVPDYRKVISESARVSRKWVIFHRTPIANGKTHCFKKLAYETPCIEIHFNEKEFIDICSKNNLRLHEIFEISNGEPSYKTYVFNKVDIA